VLILVALKPWSRLLFGAFLGTVLFVIGWSVEFYANEAFWRTAFFIGCFFLIFALGPRLIREKTNNDGRPSPWDGLAQAVLPPANAAMGFLAFYEMFQYRGADWAGPWLAVGFAAFYLLLLKLPARGRLHDSPEVLSALHLVAAVVFLTIAVPLKAHGRWLTTYWLVEGAALLWIAERVHLWLLRVLALLCLTLGVGALVLINPAASTMPFFNERFATYCVGIAAFVFAVWVARQATDDANTSPAEWPAIAAGAAITVNALILLAVSWEIHSFWWYLRWHGNWNLMHDYHMYAQFTYSAFFMLFGAILLGIGFGKGSSFLRWQALLLLAVTIGKVFLVDISALSQGYRIFSFIGLGALLLGVSFVYQRDWLHLREPERETT